MQRWEYKTFKIAAKGIFSRAIEPAEFEAKLNELGSQGWELVSSFDTNMTYGTTREMVAVLKRPRD